MKVGDGAVNLPKEVTKHDLLTAEDEVALSKQHKIYMHVEAQRSAMSTELGREVTNMELAKALEITDDHLMQLIEKGGIAKQVLVQANMRLIFHIAKYYRARGVAYPDLVQEGTFGLMKAVDKYDPERGFRFSTYASWWIKQAVSRAIAEKSRLVRLPVHIHDLVSSVLRIEKQFSIQYNRKPTTEELAEQLALPLSKVQLLLKCARVVTTIDDSLYSNRGKMKMNNEVQFRDQLISTQVEPSSLNDKNSVREELRFAMAGLSQREAQIVEMRFGLGDGNQMTLEEIGRQFNVTRERIRQIEARALSKMRQPIRMNDFKDIIQEQQQPIAIDFGLPSASVHEYAEAY